MKSQQCFGSEKGDKCLLTNRPETAEISAVSEEIGEQPHGQHPREPPTDTEMDGIHHTASNRHRNGWNPIIQPPTGTEMDGIPSFSGSSSRGRARKKELIRS